MELPSFLYFLIQIFLHRKFALFNHQILRLNKEKSSRRKYWHWKSLDLAALDNWIFWIFFLLCSIIDFSKKVLTFYSLKKLHKETYYISLDFIIRQFESLFFLLKLVKLITFYCYVKAFADSKKIIEIILF